MLPKIHHVGLKQYGLRSNCYHTKLSHRAEVVVFMLRILVCGNEDSIS